jgi:hypothetical protein
MTKQQINKAVKVVAEATSSTEQEVINKMFAKDYWTLFLIDEASK